MASPPHNQQTLIHEVLCVSATPSLTIAIDASRTTRPQPTGTEHYALQLIRHLVALNDQREHPHRLRLYFRDAPPEGLFIASRYVSQHIIPFPRLWTHLRFALALWRDRPDVTFVPAHTLPLWFPGPSVVTIHDLGYHYFPEAHPRAQRYYLAWSTRHSARRATHILCDSQTTADDLTRLYQIPADKITVVYPGVEPPPAGVMAATRRKYGLPEQYFLFIGTLQPRKNIARIVRAYQRWKQANPDDPAGLVLAGGKGWLFDETWVQGVDNVYLPGYIDEADKGALLAGARALVFPTLYEGFGFPVVEAMHSGVPVIVSNNSSLPELVGDGGLLVDPLDVNAITIAMDLLTWHRDLHWTLRNKAYAQVARFTWFGAAEQVLSVLERAAGHIPQEDA